MLLKIVERLLGHCYKIKGTSHNNIAIPTVQWYLGPVEGPSRASRNNTVRVHSGACTRLLKRFSETIKNTHYKEIHTL